MIMIYDKGNSHCQICHVCVVGYLRKTLLCTCVYAFNGLVKSTFFLKSPNTGSIWNTVQYITWMSNKFGIFLIYRRSVIEIALNSAINKPAASRLLRFTWYSSRGMDKCPLVVSGSRRQEHSPETVRHGGRQSGGFVNHTVNLNNFCA